MIIKKTVFSTAREINVLWQRRSVEVSLSEKSATFKVADVLLTLTSDLPRWSFTQKID